MTIFSDILWNQEKQLVDINALSPLENNCLLIAINLTYKEISW